MSTVRKILFSRGGNAFATFQRCVNSEKCMRRPFSSTPIKNNNADEAENQSTPVPVEEVRRYVTECMISAGADPGHSASLADVLVTADYRGHYSHGLNRLEMYVRDILSGICDGKAEPIITKDKYSTALVDGQNALGPVVGNFSMKLAINKAKEYGVGWVTAHNSNHYGIAGWYGIMAAEEGLLGLSVTNTSPLVAPTRAKQPALGTNPIAFAAPGLNGDNFVLDMATCTVALGKIEMKKRKCEPLPLGWAIDSNGKETTDPVAGMSGALMPLGGSEYNSGYKGYGLAAMVEILCGISAGSKYGPNIRKWMNTTGKADLGQCFIAVDPDCFAPGFKERMSDLMSYLRNMDPADPGKPVLVAGDPERAHIALVDSEGGIRYHVNQITASAQLAEELKVKPMRHIS